MKKVWQIFIRDCKRLLRSPVAVIVAVGICIIPSLYAWFNIAANFDPYANTGDIKVAVANSDKGAESELTGRLDAGGEIVSNLKENDALGWVFVDETRAVDGVKSGEYYAAIVIPETFSQDMLSITSGTFSRPEFTYYINEKKNAIAPKITDTGAETVEKEINSTFTATASKAVADIIEKSTGSLSEELGRSQESLLERISLVSDNIGEYQAGLEKFRNSSDSSNEAIEDTKGTLDALTEAAGEGSSAMDKSSEILEHARTAAADFSTGISSALSQGQGTLADISAASKSAVGEMNGKILEINSQVDGMITKAEQAASLGQNVLDNLESFNNTYPTDAMTSVITALEAELEGQKQTISSLRQGNDSIGNSVETASDSLSRMDTIIQEAGGQLLTSRESFDQQILPEISRNLDSFSALSGRLSGILDGVEPSTEQVKAVLDELAASLDDIQAVLVSTGDSLQSVQNILETAMTDLKALENSKSMELLFDLSGIDGESVADFMSSPVEVETKDVYSIDNYGSALAPFYTNLAIWVGGIVLIAIFKLEADKEKVGKFSAVQGYFGRWLLFVAFGIAQSLIVCLGDIYLLDIQSANPAAFLFAGVFASFVYVNIIYALSITFKHIGKAVCVILVIVQIPGSAGTYPIEMTPGFFQALHPLLPFTYGINAMREAVAGIYRYHYLKDMLCLTAFIPIALLIGVAVRPWMLNLNLLFDKKLAQTDLMLCEENGMPNERMRLSSVVRMLAGQEEFQEQLREKAAGFERRYERRIKRGFLAILVIPLIFLLLMFSIDSKMIFLVLWIASIIGIALYLICLEYIHESLNRQMRLSKMSREELHQVLKNKKEDSGR